MYFGGISIFGIPGPLTGPISTLAGTYPSLERYLALILCKKARPVRFGALAEFPRELVYFQGIGRVFWGYFNFRDSWAFDRPDFNASRNISISGKISSIDIVQKSATSPVWCTS